MSRSLAATTRYWQAHFHTFLKQQDRAIAAFRAAIAIDPNYAPIYSELGAFLESQGQSEKAVLAFEKYLILAPNFIDSAAVREKMQRMRRPPPTLRRNN